MHLTCEQLNPGPCKTYLISNDETNEVALIDQVIDRVEEYREIISFKGLRCSLIIDTNTHADHISEGA